MTDRTRSGAGATATICVVSEGSAVDLCVTFGPATTVGHLAEELARRLPGRWADGLWIDGSQFANDRYLVDTPLTDGAVISATQPAPEPLAIGQIVAVAGWDAGRQVRLQAGSYPAGAVASEPVRVDRNGLQVGGSPAVPYGSTFGDGRTAWRYEPIPHQVSPPGGPFNRPPRPPQPILANPPPLPKREAATRTGTVLRWTMIAGPLLMGAVMILIFRRPSFAIFMALGPLMAIMNWVDGKRRSTRTDRIADLAYRAALGSAVKKYRGWLASRQADSSRLHPDLATVLSWPTSGHHRLWERRPHHPDFGLALVGYAPLPNYLPVEGPPDPHAIETLGKQLPVATFPIVASLAPGRVIGIVGPQPETAALARGLIVQLVIHQGPADIRLRVSASPSRAGDWTWTSLLPHARRDGGHTIEVTAEAAEGLLAGEAAVLVLDHLYEPRFSGAVRRYAEQQGTVVVVADHPSQLPATVDQLVSISAQGITFVDSSSNRTYTGTGVYPATDVCSAVARTLMSIRDPESEARDGTLPPTVELFDLLGFQNLKPNQVIERWQREPGVIAAPIGLAADGVVKIDIVKDGPHGLLAGTTGAGKSELLRTLIASLAATVSPEHVNFVLIDYKGGSTFDACADLPHVVGVVTDLDEHLAARAMTCLEAELGHREQLLRSVGVSDLAGYLSLTGQSSLPRLYLIVDEFATMAADLPEFMDALVDISARGRSLGVHLMLATQRPAGVIKDTIRANTNLRIALRVQTTADSRDVLDDDSAARLSRSTPGRGYVRFGPSELTGFQTALVSSRSANLPANRLHLDPIGLPGRNPRSIIDVPGTDQPNDLEILVKAIRQAAELCDIQPARTPWPPALPTTLPLSDLVDVPGAFGLVDEPERQRQTPYTWERQKGHLALYGMPGAGPELAAEAAIAAICATVDDVLIFTLIYGTHRYRALSELPGITPAIEPDDHERQLRLIRWLGEELKRRRTEPADDCPDIVLLIDDVAGCLKSLEPFHLASHSETMTEILTKGYISGIHVIATAYSPTALRARLAVGFTQRLAFHFPDRSHYAALGIRLRQLPVLGAGRAVDVASERVVQVVTDYSSVAFPPRPDREAIPIMPTVVTGLAAVASMTHRPWRIPLGIGERDLAEIGVELDEGDHLLIAGPARSGKTSTLALIAAQAATANPALPMVAVTPRRSRLKDAAAFTYVVEDRAAVPNLANALAEAQEPVLVLVDDAELVDGFEGLLKARNPQVTVIAAIRSTESVRMYGHWTRRLRDSGQILLLQTDNSDLAEMKLPKLSRSSRPGRGFLCIDGTAEAIQVATRHTRG